ncbi:MAG TPA: hypothetical protein VKM54_23095 [Myxococcota bacterium]|nr:hypothetical protein [Myxococcota bacterium]
MYFRTTLLAFTMLLTPLVARADYLDVITSRLKDGCPIDRYLGVVDEFRGVMKSQGYKYSVEVAPPFTGPDLSVVYWIGREPSFATFGQESDRWDAAIAKPGTPEAKVNEKLAACSTNVSRSGGRTR